VLPGLGEGWKTGRKRRKKKRERGKKMH